MNTDDINLAYKIRHALNEQLDALPASTTDRLAQARARAMARKKADAPQPAVRHGWSGFSYLLSGQALSRVAVAVPLLALVIGMGGIYQHEQQERLAELADIDAAVLADELPLTAYLDTGFPAYLESQQRQQ
ncbi:DUF3619 family protein [Massilia sp. AB1]|uniref:DUF3619 family protein n=1 Tax=Massilia sp. AB1 TaxID=2823371 RepID=UPI001B833CBA|nr:DUF3619 family protein [Massilia sp. AB1]MBQ5942780.1 DUF3619 family protein [Massilia sp. AB1]